MEKELIKLGLSENEAKIYLAVLNYGPESAANIAKQAGTKRSTAYLELDNLIKLGLVSEELRKKKRLFRAESPDRLASLTKRMRRKVVAAEIVLDELVSELKQIQNQSLQPPEVSLYHGIEGIKNIIERASESKNPWYFFGAGRAGMESMLPEEFSELMVETDLLREQARRPKVFFITDESIKKIKHFQSTKPAIREIKILKELIESKSLLLIFDNKLAILNFTNSPFALVLESKETVDILKIMYKLVWNNLK